MSIFVLPASSLGKHFRTLERHPFFKALRLIMFAYFDHIKKANLWETKISRALRRVDEINLVHSRILCKCLLISISFFYLERPAYFKTKRSHKLAARKVLLDEYYLFTRAKRGHRNLYAMVFWANFRWVSPVQSSDGFEALLIIEVFKYSLFI